MSGGNRPNSNYVLYGNPMPNFNVRKDRVVNSIRVTDPTTLHLPSASILDIDPQSPHPPGEGNNDPVTNSTLRGSDNEHGVPQAGAIVYCSTPITQNKTKDPCFDGRNHLYFSDGKNWIPLANCLPKNVHDSKAVDSLALTVLRGEIFRPNVDDPPSLVARSQLWAPPQAGPLSPGPLEITPWNTWNRRSSRGSWLQFKVPENGLFEINFQAFCKFKPERVDRPNGGFKLFLGLIFVDPDWRGGRFPIGAWDPQEDGFVLPGAWYNPPLGWPAEFNIFNTAPRRIFRETAWNPDTAAAHGTTEDNQGQNITMKWVINTKNIRESPLWTSPSSNPGTASNPNLGAFWNLNPGRFKPGEEVRCWVVTASNVPFDSQGANPGGSVFEWRWGGKYMDTEKDYPDIVIEARGVSDNYHTDRENPPPFPDQFP